MSLSSHPPRSPTGLPQSPRSHKPLPPITTPTNSPYLSSEKSPSAPRWPAPNDDPIFANATIPLSPISSSSSGFSDLKSTPPPEREQSGLARFFRSCFGRGRGSESAKRRRRRDEYEVEEVTTCHWTEL